jgi:hypothetical protein
MNKFGFVLILSTLSLGFVNVGQANEAPDPIAELSSEPANDSTVNLATITCRDLMTMSGEDEEDTFIFLHGFISGRNNELIINAPALTVVTDQVRNYCIDNPEATALDAFNEFR